MRYTATGAPPKLTDDERGRLYNWIVGSDPRRHGFEFALWTREIITDLIKRKFGVGYTPQGIGNLLRGMGLSPQRPIVRAYEQDAEQVRAWKEEEYPRIQQEAVSAGASIFFGDEATVRTDYHAGTTWGAVGRTPIVQGSGNRMSVNMISAVSAQGKMLFSFVDEGLTSEAFI
ncbi:hypothetical protein HNR23_003471 [Nocardiopsis mwathae]|uniref:Winged helix-turn helix domain-containing protein n=1 Tax=Nocardiopsis mwathae TaxID=1472723 RepID=A0A7W9YLL5_9ACTN|nr:winged helix-turn-helix domain-containing protein [Nocardiopsis mwathae]MBB6173411.1 hypothetical protein [Nocardiopsis mwathae]